jgi:hypothetical protein
MTLRDYYRSLNDNQRKQYAERAGTSKKYCDSHLMRTRPSRIPKRDLMQGLANASNGAVSFSDVVDYFYHVNQAA